ncbi:MAG: isoprenylcysteine carboxylmethyltransferase family protein [Anaerolineales bacterium]|nr:isoprenylcysteine carboxylmethyltransferase family protein [Anaerolineales bacterium]
MSTQQLQTKLDLSPAQVRKAVAGLIIISLLPAVILFLAAGRVDWWEAWTMVGLLVVATLGSRVIVLRKHPELAAERARWTDEQNVKSWDKRLMPIVALYGPFLMWLVAGLDKRWNGSPALPLGLELGAFAVVILGYSLSVWALIANKYFSAVVRIQKDRGHAVVTTGPYRFVRHPGYAGGAIAYLVTPIALGTLWAYLPVLLTIVALAIRTALEDRTLQNELPGYREYAARVRYRLMPGVW